MTPTMAPLAVQFGLNTRFVENAFNALNDEQASERFGQANPLNFILGHLTSARYYVAQLAGGNVEPPWSDLYGHGAAYDEKASYPALEEIRVAWEKVTPVLMERLGAIDESALAAESPIPFPVEENTIGNGIAFMAMHESYHVGQTGICRRALDLDSVMS